MRWWRDEDASKVGVGGLPRLCRLVVGCGGRVRHRESVVGEKLLNLLVVAHITQHSLRPDLGFLFSRELSIRVGFKDLPCHTPPQRTVDSG